MKPHWTILFSMVAWTGLMQVAAATTDCQPEAIGKAELREIRSNYYTISGDLGGFDPCHQSVEWKLPPGTSNPPLVISVHGGGGIWDVRKISEAWLKAGYASLIFDSYTMQGLAPHKPSFWARSLTNEARQRMIWATALGAYRWAIQRSDIDTRRVYIYGISNGAAVVANLAAIVNPENVPGVIVEGLTPVGVGLPDKIQTRLLAVFGKLDDFGSSNSSVMRWDIRERCFFNVRAPGLPLGTSEVCSRTRNKDDLMGSASEWLKTARANGGNVEVAYVENVAHCGFCRPLNIRKMTWANGKTMGASLGATEEGRIALMNVMSNFMNGAK
jgi:pimeloyl-ACP methyl ester carboxylesterase